MAACDGHVLRPRNREAIVRPGTPLESQPCTRWEELTSTAVNHARWNEKLGVPCEFILLNSPHPQEPVDGQDVFRIDPRLGNPKAQVANMEAKLRRSRPGGGTPLTESLDYLRRRLHTSKEELLQGSRKVMLTIATDGVPSGSRDSFVQVIRRIARELPLYIVIRLCTDDPSVH